MLVLTLVIQESNRFDAFGISFAKSVTVSVKNVFNSSAIFLIKSVSFVDSNFSWKS